MALTQPKYVLIEAEVLEELRRGIREIKQLAKDNLDESKGINSALIDDRTIFEQINNTGKDVLNWTKSIFDRFPGTEKIIKEAVHESMADVVEPLTEEIEGKKTPEAKRQSFLLGLRDALARKLTPRAKKPTVKL